MLLSYWRGGRSACGLLCAMLILSPMALAACGSIPAPGSSAAGNAAGPPAAAAAGKAVPADRALCANPASASRVLISRSASLRQIQPEQALPPVRALVTAIARVRALARALCALPTMGQGVFHCPALFEGSFTLSFTADGRGLPVVTIQESGCEIVTGLGPARVVNKSPVFRTALARAVGTSSPVLPVFLPGDPPRSDCQPSSGRTLGNTHCPVRAMSGGSSHK
jgi:hypothetical protein